MSFERVNPHSLIFVEQSLADGQIRRWAVEGPDAARLAAMRVGPNSLEPGDVIEVCGFATKQGALTQRAAQAGDGEPAVSAPRVQPFNGMLLVLAGGEKRFWSDYGHLGQCIGDEERGRLPHQWPSAARP